MTWGRAQPAPRGTAAVYATLHGNWPCSPDRQKLGRPGWRCYDLVMSSAPRLHDEMDGSYGARAADVDQLIVMHGVDWKTYDALRELLDSPGIRLTYLEGALEIMSPSKRHEHEKKTIARMIEIFALERDFPLHGYGSTTFRREARERGLEPDECYCVGHELGDAPDVALEIVVTSGGINRLAVYRGLGVKEVWIFRDGRFQLFSLVAERYEKIDASEVVPGLDFADMEELVKLSDQHAAVKAFRDRLRAATRI
jgi:Uma2 family endonuclease